MVYLIAAVVVSALLTYAVVWYYRRPKSMSDSIDEFTRGLRAIAPRDDLPNGRPPAEPSDELSDDAREAQERPDEQRDGR